MLPQEGHQATRGSRELLMCNEARLDELQQRVEQLQDAVDEIRAVYLGLEQHVIRATATLRVVVELVQGS
jgi:hypothetical protein